jgi:hypothetical protein
VTCSAASSTSTTSLPESRPGHRDESGARPVVPSHRIADTLAVRLALPAGHRPRSLPQTRTRGRPSVEFWTLQHVLIKRRRLLMSHPTEGAQRELPTCGFVGFVTERSPVHTSWRGFTAIARPSGYRRGEVAGFHAVPMHCICGCLLTVGQPVIQPRETPSRCPVLRPSVYHLNVSPLRDMGSASRTGARRPTIGRTVAERRPDHR